ncbi:MAG: Dam family site-specific DNA-(adenine-N6)-methyltransferase [Geobacteraceae bacterium]|nr:Dam family site-specific DNA-(adenine-N6)-methyltransferase [Geobacteraceae bacterium]
MTPFLKWAGGKRWFVHQYSHLFPTKFNRYIEPFLGSGSVYFHVKPKRALLGDSNPDLVNTYNGIKNDWRSIESLLNHHQLRHSDDHYYSVRDDELPTDPIERAARMIYLNRTCFNGIYRVNLNGKFNVPRGTKNNILLKDDNFEATALLLKRADIVLDDFEALINKAKKDDFVFADPPYTVRHNNNGFIKYNEKLFSWSDQERLARSLIKARSRGAIILSTNANHESLRELYENKGFNFLDISRYSSISASSSSRKRFEELVILTHPQDRSK